MSDTASMYFDHVEAEPQKGARKGAGERDVPMPRINGPVVEVGEQRNRTNESA